jgi:hypothetical protein
MDRVKDLLNRRPFAIAVAIVLGLVNTYLLYGWIPIAPTNVDWIFGDNATYYAGWALYRHDPHLHFPLAWTERVGYPIGTSIALMDAIPLVAILLRPLSPILPEPFQYLGLFSAACFILQAYFALSLCRRLFPSHPAFVMLASVFFVLSAPLTWRAFGHTALLSHWLILAGLDAYFREIGDRPIAWMRRFWIVLAISAGITPYVAAMCFLVALAGVGRLWLEGKGRWWQAAILTAVTAVVLIGTQVVVGVIVAPDASAYSAPGYGLFSMNLNAPVNPLDYGSILLPQLSTIHPAQVEGYSYLGLGIILLLVLGLVRRPLSPFWMANRRLFPLLVLALVCTAIAMSTTVSFGSTVLFQVPLPTFAMNALHTLRASGRLFWPAFYLIFIAALSLTFWGWKEPYRTVILIAALAVQAADLTPLRSKIHAVVGRGVPAVSPLGSPEWQGLGAKYENLVLIPPFECSPFHGAGGFYSFVWFGKLAASERMRTNNYYAARYTKPELEAHCVTLLRSQLQGRLDPRSAYVVTDGVYTVWQLAGVRSHQCQRVGDSNLCTPVADANTSYAPPPAPAPHPYTLGTELDFRLGGNAHQYGTVGWGEQTTDGTWTEGPLAMVRLGLGTPPQPGRALVIDLQAQPFVWPQHPRLHVDVVVNGQAVDQWVFRSGAVVGRRAARIPPSVVGSARELTIEFRIQNPEAPLYLGVGPSTSFMGLSVRRITVLNE